MYLIIDQVLLGSMGALGLMSILSVVIGRIFHSVPAQFQTSKFYLSASVILIKFAYMHNTFKQLTIWAYRPSNCILNTYCFLKHTIKNMWMCWFFIKSHYWFLQSLNSTQVSLTDNKALYKFFGVSYIRPQVYAFCFILHFIFIRPPFLHVLNRLWYLLSMWNFLEFSLQNGAIVVPVVH